MASGRKSSLARRAEPSSDPLRAKRPRVHEGSVAYHQLSKQSSCGGTESPDGVESAFHTYSHSSTGTGRRGQPVVGRNPMSNQRLLTYAARVQSAEMRRKRTFLKLLWAL